MVQRATVVRDRRADDARPAAGAALPRILAAMRERDIGVGVQTFDYRYMCPTDGEFCFIDDPERPGRSKAIMRDAP